MLTFEEWRHTYADVFETDDAARAAWTAACNKGYRAGVQDTRELLAAHNTGARDRMTFEQWAKNNGLVPKTYTSQSNPGGAYEWARRAWEAAHPQPMTDAALDAKRYRHLRECNSGSLVIVHITGMGDDDQVVLTEDDADAAIDAEIERLDRAAAKGGDDA